MDSSATLERTDAQAELRARHLAADDDELRRDLACAHWVTNHFEMDDLNWNHISARSNDGGILITPGNLLWDMIEPEDIVKDSENLTANIIHDAVYAANPEINAVVHLHTPCAVAVSCLTEGFLFLDQNAANFFDEIAYYDYDGISDHLNEKELIMSALGTTNSVLVMRNHGVCTTGRSVGQAWVRAWYFEKCCRLQMDVLKAQRPYSVLSDELLRKAKQSIETEFPSGMFEWSAILAKWQRNRQQQQQQRTAGGRAWPEWPTNSGKRAAL